MADTLWNFFPYDLPLRWVFNISHFPSNQFSTYEKYNGGILYLGDDFPLNIVGLGRVLVKFCDNRVKGISEVVHIQRLT